MPTQKSDFPKIGSPATRALEAEGYTQLKQLTKLSEAELLQMHGVGPKAVRILKETMKAQGLSFKEAKTGEKLKKKGSTVSRTDAVDKFMLELSHPLKAEIEALRSIIKGVDKDINEEIKWKAPSFNYKGEYLVTFNLRDTRRIHLVFHNPMIAKVKSDLLEGDYKDRRMTYFSNMKDIKAKQTAFVKAIKDLIKLQK
ncbi:MAG: DUF1801 domain-containing protein [Anaerolineales bacterium]|nr:DUF1801 domain-containing protein [Anaerolineales bacterium]MBX3035597.1 DUF1801 domain-containing protein [Anaerolineales bacterium]